MGEHDSIKIFGNVTVALLLLFIPVLGLAQQNGSVNHQTVSPVFQKADSLRYIAHFDSSNTLFRKAADQFEQNQNWLKKADALYNVSRNKIEQGRIDEAEDFLEKAYSLFQNRELQDPGFEIKYHYQKSVIAEQRADYKSALNWAEKGLELARASEGQAALTAKLLITIGDIYIARGDYQKAVDQFRASEDLYHRNELKDRRLLSRIYNGHGRAYNNTGDQSDALNYFRKSLDIDQATLPSHHPGLARINNNLAITYYHQGDYQRALDYFKNAANVLAEFHGENHRLVAAGYNNLGVVYSEIGELEEAAEYLERALAIKEEVLGRDHPDIAVGYQNLGAIYYDMEKYDQAIDYYRQSETLHLDRFSEGHPELANVYANLGEAYAAKENYEKALDYYHKDLDINMDLVDGSHPYIGDTFTKIGETYARIDNYEMALNYYRKALGLFVPDYHREGIYQNPPFDQLAYPYLLLESLKNYAHALQDYAEQSGGQNVLEESLQIYLEAVELIDDLQQSYSREESKFVLRERTVEVYRRGFEAAYSLLEETGDSQYKEYALYFVEKSRNQILLEHLRRLNARELAQIPDSLIKKEQSLQSQLTQLQTQVFDLAESPQSSDSLQGVTLQDSIFHVKKRLENHIQHLESSYPEYYQLKHKPVITRAEEIQRGILSPDKTMVSYFFGEESLFALVITKDSFDIRELPVDTLLQQDVQAYLDTISGMSSPAAFAEKSHSLYNNLISPISDLISDKELLIIPDGVLHYLPFESLVANSVSESEAVRFRDLTYLVQDYTISYAPSAGYMNLRNEKDRTEAKKQFIGFAPGFSDISGSAKRDLYSVYERPVSSLPLSQKEVEQLENIFNSSNGFWSFLIPDKEEADIYTGDRATEQTFKDLPLENYRYIHLATHAYASEEQPERSGILFAVPQNTGEDGTLYAAEVYNLQLNAQLVTLSACETGIGTIAEGEGMVSLSRAFQYAGAQNLLVSLWQVSDRSTAGLMVDFYKLNQEGDSIPRALRKAKLNMISKGQYSHPMYWAPFIFIGS